MFGEYVPGEICPGGNVRIPSLCGLLIELVSVLTGSYDTSTHTIVFWFWHLSLVTLSYCNNISRQSFCHGLVTSEFSCFDYVCNSVEKYLRKV